MITMADRVDLAFNHPDKVINFSVLKNNMVVPDALVDRDRIRASGWRQRTGFYGVDALERSGILYYLQEAGYSPGIIDAKGQDFIR